MIEKRKYLIQWLFENTEKTYTKFFKKNKPWGITKTDLLKYPNETLGKHLGLFLDKHLFELIPKVERHDVYHVIAKYGVNAEDEIALQYLCYGNGKRSTYLYSVLIIGTFILPDYFKYYRKSYQKGLRMNAFHNLDFQNLLSHNMNDLQTAIFKKK